MPKTIYYLSFIIYYLTFPTTLLMKRCLHLTFSIFAMVNWNYYFLHLLFDRCFIYYLSNVTKYSVSRAFVFIVHPLYLLFWLIVIWHLIIVPRAELALFTSLLHLCFLYFLWFLYWEVWWRASFTIFYRCFNNDFTILYQIEFMIICTCFSITHDCSMSVSTNYFLELFCFSI